MPRPADWSNCFLKRISLIFPFLFFSFYLFAQSNSRKDSTEIYQSLDRADAEALTGSLDTALGYAKIALKSSKEKKFLRGEGFAQLKVADILFQQESQEDLKAYYAEGLRIGAQLKDSFMMALAYYQKGQYLMYDDKLEEAEKLFITSLALHFGKSNSDYTALVYNDMGYLYGLKDDLEKQVEWYLKAIRIYEKTEDLSGLATTKSNLAVSYNNLGNSTKAFEYIKSSIAIREQIKDIQGLATAYESLSRMYMPVSIDSASRYQKEAMRYAEKSGVKSLMMRSYDNLSMLMDRQRNKAEALAYIQKSIAISREMNDKVGLAGKCRWAALLCGDMKDTIAMETYYKESYDLSVELNNKTLLRDYYGTRAAYYNRINDHKNAYDNLRKYYSYRDSIINKETTTNIAELQTKYETEKKDNEISRLSFDQKIKQLEIDKQKAIIQGNLLEAKQKENEIKILSQERELRDVRIKQQEKELEKQNLIANNNKQALQLSEAAKELKDKQLKNQRQVRNLMIAGMALIVILGVVLFNRYKLSKKLQQQKDMLKVRNNIAKNLHDEIGSALTSIKILSEVSQNHISRDQQKASSMLGMITEQSSRMQQGMSDIVWAIAPENDKLENMVVRIREFIARTLEPKNIHTVLTVDEALLTKSLGMEQRRDFFLIIKEAINNAAKYSGASQVKINLSADKTNILLLIEDNGVGFDTKKISFTNGLRNMRARTEALNGVFTIQSSPGTGVKLEVSIPQT